MIAREQILLLALLMTGCATMDGKGAETASTPPVRSFRGTLSLVFADGVESGHLDQAGGPCLGVSLPAKDMTKLRASGPRAVEVQGSLFQVPNDIEVATIRVNGRQVGFKQCNNTYVFVRKSRDIVWDVRVQGHIPDR